jgi:hypothetical protein
MSIDQEEPSPERPVWKRPLFVALGALAVAVAVWVVVLPMIRGSGPEPAPAAKPAPPPVAAAKPAPAPPAAAAPAPDATPRPRKKTEPPPPTPSPEPAAPTTGELHIDADVPGAMVFLDRKYLGNTPVTAKDVAPGSHHLNLTAEGYDGYSESIDVAAGPADVLVRFKEIRLNQSVDVVHKHAMGSCEGRLVADPQGIRYDTTNRNDAFSIRFADVETFEIDYLQKILKIKKRGGKQYNFTTKAATADPLFVFHRDVDKVRLKVVGAGPAAR